MKVCRCKGVSVEALMELAESGIEDWMEAAQITGAGRYCGSCIKRMRAIFDAARARRSLQAA